MVRCWCIHSTQRAWGWLGCVHGKVLLCPLQCCVLSGGRARRTRTHMLEAWTLSRAASLTLRCSVLCHIQQMRAAMIQHSARGNETKSGEVSDPGCARPAAAVLDARARMLVGRILSRAASLTPHLSALPHTQQMRAAMIQPSASGDENKRGRVRCVRERVRMCGGQRVRGGVRVCGVRGVCGGVRGVCGGVVLLTRGEGNCLCDALLASKAAQADGVYVDGVCYYGRQMWVQLRFALLDWLERNADEDYAHLPVLQSVGVTTLAGFVREMRDGMTMETYVQTARCIREGKAYAYKYEPLDMIIIVAASIADKCTYDVVQLNGKRLACVAFPGARSMTRIVFDGEEGVGHFMGWAANPCRGALSGDGRKYGHAHLMEREGRGLLYCGAAGERCPLLPGGASLTCGSDLPDDWWDDDSSELSVSSDGAPVEDEHAWLLKPARRKHARRCKARGGRRSNSKRRCGVS